MPFPQDSLRWRRCRQQAADEAPTSGSLPSAASSSPRASGILRAHVRNRPSYSYSTSLRWPLLRLSGPTHRVTRISQSISSGPMTYVGFAIHLAQYPLVVTSYDIDVKVPRDEGNQPQPAKIGGVLVQCSYSGNDYFLVAGKTSSL